MFGWKRKKQPEIHSKDNQKNDTLFQELQPSQQQNDAAEHGFCSEPLNVSQDHFNDIMEKPAEPSASVIATQSTDSPPASLSLEPHSTVMAVMSSSPANESKEKQTETFQAQNSPEQSPVLSPTTSINNNDDEATDPLYVACRRAHSFMQSYQQVLLQSQHPISLPHVDTVIVYQTDHVNETVKAIVVELAKALPVSSPAPLQQNSMSRAVYNTVAYATSTVLWVGAKAFHYVVSSEDDYNEDELAEHVEQADDAKADTVPLDAPVICVPLVSECVNELLENCGNNELMALCIHGKGEYSFATWAASASSMARGLRRHDLNLLQRVLVEAGHALIHDDYIVFGGKKASDIDIHVAVSCAKLKQQVCEIDQRILQWKAQEEECVRNAVEKKARKDIKGAMLELQKRKLVQSKIEAAHGTLLNLHQTLDTLESAHFQKNTVESLKHAAGTIKAVQEQVFLDNVDDVMLDLQDGMDTSNAIHAALCGSFGEQVSDDDLMAELNELVRLDDGDDNGKLEESESSAVKDASMRKEESDTMAAPSKSKDDASTKENDALSNEATESTTTSIKASLTAGGIANGVTTAKIKKDSAVEAPAV